MAAGLPGAVEQTLFGAPQQGNGLEKVSPSSEPIKASRVVSTNANPLPPTPPTQRELAALHLETQAALVRAHQVQSAKYQLQEQLMTLYSRQRSVLSKFARETHVPELALDCFGDDSKRQASLLAETMAQVEGLVTEQRRMQEQLERRQSLVNSNPPLSADVVMKQLMDGPLYTFKQEYSANVRQTDQRLEECVLLIGNLRQEYDSNLPYEPFLLFQCQHYAPLDTEEEGPAAVARRRNKVGRENVALVRVK
ncbi:hypothetical protein DIPPA_50236 [Diplonema papillatum]|nr:hypothetical protein DIPPA_50236 [Diplonema papillatum]